MQDVYTTGKLVQSILFDCIHLLFRLHVIFCVCNNIFFFCLSRYVLLIKKDFFFKGVESIRTGLIKQAF